MESQFGHDFSGVRVHSDSRAAESVLAVDALAYTVGQDVVVGTGQYAPGTHAGRRVLAHELAHVVQQTGTPNLQFRLVLGDAHDPAEREAETAASAVIANRPQGILHRVPRSAIAPRLVQRFAGPLPGTAEEVAARTAEEAARQLARKLTGKVGWRQFWSVVVRRFAIRGAAALTLTGADGPFPVGDLLALGLTLWTVWEIIDLWDTLWREAEAEAELQPEPQTQPQTQTQVEAETAIETETSDERSDCFRKHSYALPCEDFRDIEEVGVDFLMNEGFNYRDLGSCGVTGQVLRSPCCDRALDDHGAVDPRGGLIFLSWGLMISRCPGRRRLRSCVSGSRSATC